LKARFVQPFLQSPYFAVELRAVIHRREMDSARGDYPRGMPVLEMRDCISGNDYDGENQSVGSAASE
jgi:hypothetical protein